MGGYTLGPTDLDYTQNLPIFTQPAWPSTNYMSTIGQSAFPQTDFSMGSGGMPNMGFNPGANMMGGGMQNPPVVPSGMPPPQVSPTEVDLSVFEGADKVYQAKNGNLIVEKDGDLKFFNPDGSPVIDQTTGEQRTLPLNAANSGDTPFATDAGIPAGVDSDGNTIYQTPLEGITGGMTEIPNPSTTGALPPPIQTSTAGNINFGIYGQNIVGVDPSTGQINMPSGGGNVTAGATMGGQQGGINPYIMGGALGAGAALMGGGSGSPATPTAGGATVPTTGGATGAGTLSPDGTIPQDANGNPVPGVYKIPGLDEGQFMKIGADGTGEAVNAAGETMPTPSGGFDWEKWTPLILGGLNIAGGIYQGMKAEDAASDAAKRAQQAQQETTRQQNQLMWGNPQGATAAGATDASGQPYSVYGSLEPFANAEKSALDQMLVELGLEEGQPGTAFMETPWYGEQVAEKTKAAQQYAANSGFSQSGRMVEEAAKIGGDTMDTAYSRYMNYLTGMSSPQTTTNIGNFATGHQAQQTQNLMSTTRDVNAYNMYGMQQGANAMTDSLQAAGNLYGAYKQ